MKCRYCESELDYNGDLNADGQPECDCAEAKLERAEALNAELVAALEEIAKYDDAYTADGICPYGCDCPAIAQAALAKASNE